MSEAFVVRPSMSGSHFIIGLSEKFHDDFSDFVCQQTYSIFAARLLGMHYSDYCRYCVKNGGELHNKQGYPVAYFEKKENAEKIIKEINKNYAIMVKTLK